MIIIMKQDATRDQLGAVVEKVQEHHCKAHTVVGEEQTIVAVIGDTRVLDPTEFELMEGVQRAMRVLQPYKLATRSPQRENSTFPLNGHRVGGKRVVVMAGPCSVESRSQLLETAWAVKEAGADLLRGGAFKPRTSPYSFQGMGEEGLKILAEAREATGLAVVTEVMSPSQVTLVSDYADVLQIGTRNMQNYALLRAVGETNRPVLLKRGMMSTLEELLMSAEYILSMGNGRVMLCERGIRTFETYTRNTLDINAVPALKNLSHLPVIVDPSHATGRWELVTAISKAAVAAGADGLIIEVHMNPDHALSDGAQSLRPDKFAALVRDVRRIAQAVDRE